MAAAAGDSTAIGKKSQVDESSLDPKGFELCRDTRTKLFGSSAADEVESYLKEDQRIPHKKVTIVGIGAVGMAAAFAI